MKINHRPHKVGVPAIFALFLMAAACGLFRKSSDTTDMSPVQVEELVDHPFDFEPEVANFKAQYPRLTLTAEPVENIHVKGRVDTIYHLKRGENRFLIYKRTEDGKELFYRAVIKHRKMPLQRGVKVGMARKDFFKKVGLENATSQNPLTLKGSEPSNILKVYFKNDKISRIEIEHYID